MEDVNARSGTGVDAERASRVGEDTAAIASQYGSEAAVTANELRCRHIQFQLTQIKRRQIPGTTNRAPGGKFGHLKFQP